MVSSWSFDGQLMINYSSVLVSHGQFVVNHSHLIVSSCIFSHTTSPSVQGQSVTTWSIHDEFIVGQSHFMFSQDFFLVNSWSVHGQSWSVYGQSWSVHHHFMVSSSSLHGHFMANHSQLTQWSITVGSWSVHGQSWSIIVTLLPVHAFSILLLHHQFNSVSDFVVNSWWDHSQSKSAHVQRVSTDL